MSHTILGLVGLNGCGKDSVAEHLVKTKGFTHISLSDIIREEAKQREMFTTTENLIKLGKELREKEGDDVLATRALKRIESNKNYVISSIRHPAEVLTLLQKPKFNLVSIDRSFLDRYNSVNSRKRVSEVFTMEQFAEQDRRTFHTDGSGQQVAYCMAMAPYHILNIGDLQMLGDKALKLVESIRRPTWPEYFMMIAHASKLRSTCDRLHAGSAIWNKQTRKLISTGYNGSPAERPHCDDVGHEIEENHCIATIHGEENAIMHADKHGGTLEGCIISTTGFPCYTKCYKKIVNEGIKEIHYDQAYREDKRVWEDAKKHEVKIIQVSLPKHHVF